MLVVNKIEMKKIGEIRPYVRNPRKNDKTVKLLVDIIPKVGFNVPIVIDKKGVIVKGHARFNAAIKLGMEEVPCVITEADEEQIKLDRIADNRISEFSEWLGEGLMHELDMLTMDFSALEFDMPNQIDAEDMKDFDMFADEEGEELLEDAEAKKKKYEEYLARQAQIVTEKDIERAEKKYAAVPSEKPKYYKCVCEKCGHIMFVDAKNMWSPDEDK